MMVNFFCFPRLTHNGQGLQPTRPYLVKDCCFIINANKYKKLLNMQADLASENLRDTGLLRLHQGFLRPALRGGR